MPSEVSSEDVGALESIESAAWMDMYEAQAASSAHRVEVLKAPEGVVLFGFSDVPWTEFNRAQGFRPGRLAAKHDLQAMIEWLRRHAASPWSMQVPQPALDVGQLAPMREIGLAITGRGTVKLRRSAAVAPMPLPGAFEIREVDADSAHDFGQTVRSGFGGPEPLVAMFAALPGRPGWRTYVAYHDGVPAACGALYVLGHLGWLGIGATRPKWRGRGAQSALIQRRIADGADAGVVTFAVETAASATDGEQPASLRNLVRAGFNSVYLRRSFEPVQNI